MSNTTEYLESLRCTVWPGESWDLTDPKERAKAADWLAKTIEDVSWVTRQK